VKQIKGDTYNLRLLESDQERIREMAKTLGAQFAKQFQEPVRPGFWAETAHLKVSSYQLDVVHYYYTDGFLLRPGLDRANVFIPDSLADASSSFVCVSPDDPYGAEHYLFAHGYDPAATDNVAENVLVHAGAVTNMALDFSDLLAGWNNRWARFLWVFVQAQEGLMGADVIVDMRGRHQ